MFSLADHDEELRYFSLSAKRVQSYDFGHVLRTIDDRSLSLRGQRGEEYDQSDSRIVLITHQTLLLLSI